MPFKRYESRPITRLAHEITEDDVIFQASHPVTRMILPNTYCIRVGEVEHTFKAYEEIKTGDFVVFLNEDDIYHCSREVFLERNIVPGAPEDSEEEA